MRLEEITRITCSWCLGVQWSWEPPVKAHLWFRSLGWTTSRNGCTYCPKCSEATR